MCDRADRKKDSIFPSRLHDPDNVKATSERRGHYWVWIGVSLKELFFTGTDMIFASSILGKSLSCVLMRHISR